MSKPAPKFGLPLKKLSLKGDLRIRARLLHARIKRIFRFGFSRSLLTRFLAPTLAVLIILPFAKIGIDGYVYGNDAIVRGDFLYDWKRNIELNNLQAMNNPFNRANYFLQLSEWRMREADVAFEREVHGEFSFLIPNAQAEDVFVSLSVNSIPEGLIAEGVLFFQKSVNETKNVPKLKQPAVFKNIKATLANNAFRLDEIERQISEENRKRVITPIKNQYLEIARDWEMDRFSKENVPQEPVPKEPLPEKMPPKDMPFVEPKIVDFRFYGDQWNEAKTQQEKFDREIEQFKEKNWNLKEEEIQHFEAEKRRLREEEEMRRRGAEIRKFEEKFLQEAEGLDKNWVNDFVNKEVPCPDEFRPVCGEFVPKCPEPECPQTKPVQETFPNECQLQRSGAHFLHEGKCELPEPEALR